METLNTLKDKINEIAKNGKLSPEELLSFNEVINKTDVEFNSIMEQNKKLSENNENLKNSNYSLLMRIASNDTPQDSSGASPSTTPEDIFNNITDIFNNITSQFFK